uniref:Putative secreted peptide n=1 Tax=Anopheles braziliensis TaxID=58242 RepID=A0A2M3ZT44_9DIPT
MVVRLLPSFLPVSCGPGVARATGDRLDESRSSSTSRSNEARKRYRLETRQCSSRRDVPIGPTSDTSSPCGKRPRTIWWCV